MWARVLLSASNCPKTCECKHPIEHQHLITEFVACRMKSGVIDDVAHDGGGNGYVGHKTPSHLILREHAEGKESQ